MDYLLLVSVVIYMAAMLFIGWFAYKKTSNLTDYMLGGRGLGPAVTALSAGASDMSSWLLMGLPGAMYLTGISSTWIVFGLTLGAGLTGFLSPQGSARTQRWRTIRLRFQVFWKTGLMTSPKCCVSCQVSLF